MFFVISQQLPPLRSSILRSVVGHNDLVLQFALTSMTCCWVHNVLFAYIKVI